MQHLDEIPTGSNVSFLLTQRALREMIVRTVTGTVSHHIQRV
jgi:hypothetical protein